jgi:LPS sulfotransferase NodH
LTRRYPFIFVRRRNVIAQAVSLWTALQDGCWTSLHNVLPHALPEYDELKILQHVKQIYESNAHFEMFFDYHGITPLQLHYEDFHNDESQLLVQLADYYRCDDPPTASALPIARQITRQKLDWERMLRSAGKSHVSDVLGRFVGSSS